VGKSAERLGISVEELKASVEEIIRERERQKALEDRAARDEDRKHRRGEQQREQKAQAKRRMFKQLKGLPADKQQAEIRLWCDTYCDDPKAVAEQLAEYLGTGPVADVEIEKSTVDIWSEPVDGDALVKKIQARIARHVVMSETGRIGVAFWVLHSWLHDSIAIYSPILAPYSSEPDSGKSTLLYLLSWMCPRRHVEVTSRVSLYQTIDAEHPTLFIEEADRLFEDDALQEIINSSWTRGSKVYRVIRGNRVAFDIFCPKAIALLGRKKVPPATASRCIFIRMMPKLSTEKVDEFRHEDDEELKEIRLKASRWAVDNKAALKDARPTMPAEFLNRPASNWRLMLAIADAISGDWPKKLRAAALQLAPSRDQNLSWGKRLLMEFRAAFEKVKGAPIASADMAKWLTDDPLGVWSDYKGRPITQRQIAQLLRDAYQIHHTKVGPASKRVWGYRAEDFAEVFARILQDPLPTSGHPDSKARKGFAHRKKPKSAECPDVQILPGGPSEKSEESDIALSKSKLASGYRLGHRTDGKVGLFGPDDVPVAEWFNTRAEAVKYAKDHPIKKDATNPRRL
jgi:hypothetical protein